MSAQYIDWLCHTFDIVTGAHAETTTELRALCRENGQFMAILPAPNRVPDPELWKAAAELANRYVGFLVDVRYSDTETLTTSTGGEAPMPHAVIVTLDLDTRAVD